RLIRGGTMLLQDRIERAFLAVVSELHALHVVRNGPGPAGHLHDLVGRHEQQFGLGIYESTNQPGACDAVDVNVLSSHPLHDAFLRAPLRARMLLRAPVCAAPIRPERLGAWPCSRNDWYSPSNSAAPRFSRSASS